MNLVQRTGLRLGFASFFAAVALGAVGPAGAQENLAPGSTQRVQGTIHADAGRGMVEMTSRATTLPDNLGQQTAARLQTAEGQAAVPTGDARPRARAWVPPTCRPLPTTMRARRSMNRLCGACRWYPATC